MSGVIEEQIIEMVKKEKENVDYARVYFALRKMRVRPIIKSTIEKLRVCIALNKLGIPITTYTVGKCIEREIGISSLTGTLHNLGDKHILTLIRDGRSKTTEVVHGRLTTHLRWILNPVFLRALGDMHYEVSEDE